MRRSVAMKSFFQILVCCFANAALAMCSSQADGEPVIYIVDYGGLPWKFVVTNNVAEIRDASYDNRRVSLYNFELYSVCPSKACFRRGRGLSPHARHLAAA